MTPFGGVPLEVGTEKHLSSLRVNPGQMLFARYDDLMFRVGVLPRWQSLLVDAVQAEHEVKPVAGESFYRLNDGDRHPVRLESAGGPPRRRNFRFEFELPPPLALDEPGAAVVQRSEGDIHALYLSFLVDGQPCAIDLEFGVDLETRRVIAAPATP